MNEQDLVLAYKSGEATADIAERFKISVYKVNKVLKHNKIILIKNRIRKGANPYHKNLAINNADIKKLYNLGKTNTEISKELNCSRALIIQRLRSLGLLSNKCSFKIATNIVEQIGQLAFDKLSNRNWLFENYIKLKKSTRMIASELNCGKKTVISFIKRHKIPIKRANIGIYKSAYGKCKDFWYDSNWEKMTAIKFDNDKLVLKFIKDPFPLPYTDKKGKSRLYYPDFLVILNDYRMFLIEIKPDGLLSYVEEKTNAGLNSGFKYVILNIDDKFPW